MEISIGQVGGEANSFLFIGDVFIEYLHKSSIDRRYDIRSIDLTM